MNEKPYSRLGMVARWKPVHLGQAPVLRALCQQSKQALIGVGSSNRYNLRNPFTYEETCAMLELVLCEFDNYEIFPVPDLDDGPRWRTMVKKIFGEVDVFVSDNPYVRQLLQSDYPIIRPVKLLLKEEHIAIDGTMVRIAMAKGEGWQELVPSSVANYLQSNQLDERFRREFGLATLATVLN